VKATFQLILESFKHDHKSNRRAVEPLIVMLQQLKTSGKSIKPMFHFFVIVLHQ